MGNCSLGVYRQLSSFPLECQPLLVSIPPSIWRPLLRCTDVRFIDSKRRGLGKVSLVLDFLQVSRTEGCSCRLGGDAWCNAFLARHQCWSAGSSLAWGSKFRAFCKWHFLKLVVRGFLRVLRFPPLLYRLLVQPIK